MLAYQAARNQAQQAAFQQAQARGAFSNTAIQQQMAAGAGRTSRRNNAARAQYLQEQYALRNQPINEITRAAVGSPGAAAAVHADAAAADHRRRTMLALINQNFQQQFQNYQQQNQNQPTS